MTFIIHITPETDRNELSKLFDLIWDKQEQEIKDLMSYFNIDYKYAAAIHYLRTRSRHTPELECELLDMYDAGKPCPDMNTFGVKDVSDND